MKIPKRIIGDAETDNGDAERDNGDVQTQNYRKLKKA